MKTTFPVCSAIFLTLLSVSCNEDPELVEKHGKQKTEIARLDAELALLQERLKYVPPDQSEELDQTIAETEKLEAKRAGLADEVAALQTEHTELVKKFEDYQRKYAVR